MRIAGSVPVFLAALVCASACAAAAGPEAKEPLRPGPVSCPLPAMDAVTDGVHSTVQALLEHGIVVDTNKARRAAIQAVATAADPLSRLLSADEAGTIAEEGNDGIQAVKRKPVELIEKWPGQICYMKFNGLYRRTGPEIIEAISGATNGVTGMILDLRGAAGTGLDCVESIAGLFVGDDREIFCVRGGNGVELDRRSTKKCGRLGMPAVFLVDEGTSAAAELLAAVVKGGFEVLLIGRTTRGDPLIREKVALKGGEVLYIGTRRVVPLLGEDCGHGGVKPDIVVQAMEPVVGVTGTNAPPRVAEKTPDKDESGRDALAERTKTDPVLRRSADVLMGLRTLDTRALRL